MSRLLTTLVLLAAGIAAVPGPSAGATAESPGTLKAAVSYGHEPIRTADPGQKAKLRFSGERGDLVNLARWTSWLTPCGSRVLTHRGHKVTPFALGYWKLPADGRYVAKWRPGCAPYDAENERVRLQLRRVVLKDLRLDGGAVTMSKRTNRTYVARVRVPKAQRVMVRSSKDIDHVSRLRGAFTTEPVGGHRVVLEPGVRPHSEAVAESSKHAVRPGRYLVTVMPGSSVQATTAQVTQVSLDAATTQLTRAEPGREQVLAFVSQAGQFVYAELSSDAPRYPRGKDLHVELTGPDGNLVRDFNLASGWELPVAGTYRMAVSRLRTDIPATTSARVRTASVAPDLVVGGPAVRFAPTDPGRWVVSQVQLNGPHAHRLVASNATPGETSWRALLAWPYTPHCSLEDTSLGCGDYFVSEVGPGSPSAPVHFWSSGRHLVVHSPGAGSTAAVNLAVQRDP